MMAFATFPTLIPTFQAQWGISNAEAGWISGVYFAGYVVAVAILTALTDRVSVRGIYLGSMAVSAVAVAGFAVGANGVWSASAWRLLQGIGLAGTYMPGLKALTDQLPESMQSRGTAFYTASFGIGASVSYFVSGVAGQALGWELTFWLCALGPLAAVPLAAIVLRSSSDRRTTPTTSLLDFRPVLRNRRALGFTLAYAAHNGELFAFRSWLVAFLVFCQSQQTTGSSGLWWSAATVAAVVNLFGLPSSVLGNELAAVISRQRAAILIMTVSALVGVCFGFLSLQPLWLVVLFAFVYGVTITGESATLTAGLVKVAAPQYKGATMAMYSVIGFVGAFLGPVVFGIVLDAAGGNESASAWGIAFSVTSVVLLLGPISVWKLVGLRPRLY